MNHRHLLPDEIDLLIDGEVGFGVAPLQAHVEACEHCRAELDVQRSVASALNELPHFSPSPLFAERVMSQVQVFQPWHVAALDTVLKWSPRSRPARALAAASLTLVALVLSVSAVWLVVRLDAFLFFFSVAADRVRSWLLGGLAEAAGDLFGQPALDAVRASGGVGVALALTGFLATLIVAAFGLRALATTARRRRA